MSCAYTLPQAEVCQTALFVQQRCACDRSKPEVESILSAAVDSLERQREASYTGNAAMNGCRAVLSVVSMLPLFVVALVVLASFTHPLMYRGPLTIYSM
eukprot:763050-Amphidinium_carterae.1